MNPVGGHRVGYQERDDEERFHKKAAGASPRDQNPQLVQAVVSAMGALSKWNGRLFADIDDAASIRLQRELERALAPFFPSPDHRRANGRKPGQPWP